MYIFTIVHIKKNGLYLIPGLYTVQQEMKQSSQM